MGIAIVTGASSGIGARFVQALAAQSNVSEIWAVARDESKLAALKDSMTFPIEAFSVDVSDLEAVRRFEAALNQRNPDVTWLVNSAGFGKFCGYDDITIEESLAMVRTNCEGPVAMTLTVLPYMKNGARIINMGSAAAFQPLPYENIYAATKVFVRSYSRSLNRELKKRDVTVTCACPSWVNTEFFKTANSFETAKGATNYSGIVEPEDVVRKAVADALKGRDMSVISARTKFEHLLTKVLPQRVVMDTWLRRQGFK